MSMKPGVRLRRAAAAVLVLGGLWSSQASAQGVACNVVAHRNVTMFERMVAEKIAGGWDVKGGIAYDEISGWFVLMCSR